MDRYETKQRSWGQITTLVKQPSCGDSEGYKVRRIKIPAGRRLDIQSLYNREEHWVIIKGYGVATLDFSSDPQPKFFQKVISTGQHFKIKTRQKYRLEAINDLDLVEIQFGRVEEDDFVR